MHLMLKLLLPLPKQITVAFSGGVDSVAVVDFLSRKHDVTCAFFHHGTENSDRAMEFVAKFCNERHLPMLWGTTLRSKDKAESQEEFWRKERYNFLYKLGTVVTCHHLDDCVETYLWGCMHGTPKVIPLRNKDIIRPFLTTRKQEFVNWCTRKNIEWCHDLSNDDTKYTRNYIRHEMMPHVVKVNPGIHLTVKKIVEKQI